MLFSIGNITLSLTKNFPATFCINNIRYALYSSKPPNTSDSSTQITHKINDRFFIIFPNPNIENYPEGIESFTEKVSEIINEPPPQPLKFLEPSVNGLCFDNLESESFCSQSPQLYDKSYRTRFSIRFC